MLPDIGTTVDQWAVPVSSYSYCHSLTYDMCDLHQFAFMVQHKQIFHKDYLLYFCFIITNQVLHLDENLKQKSLYKNIAFVMGDLQET